MNNASVSKAAAALAATALFVQGGASAAESTGVILDVGRLLSAAETGATGTVAGGTIGGVTMPTVAIAVGGLAAVAATAAVVVNAQDSNRAEEPTTPSVGPQAGGDGGGSVAPDAGQPENPVGTGDPDSPLGFAGRADTLALPRLGEGVFFIRGYDPRYSFGPLSGGKVSHHDLPNAQLFGNPFVPSSQDASMAVLSMRPHSDLLVRAVNWVGNDKRGGVADVQIEKGGTWGVRFGTASGGDAFGPGKDAHSMFVSATYEVPFAASFSLIAAAHYGVSDLQSVRYGQARLSGDAYGIGAIRHGIFSDTDRAGVVVGSPLGFRGGEAYGLPDAGRMELQTFYARTLDEGAQLRFGATYANRSAEGDADELTLGVRFVRLLGLFR